MDLEPELATVEVPAGRVLRCGAARPGRVTGTMGWSRGRVRGFGRPRLPDSDPASPAVPGSSSPLARGPRSYPSARMVPRTSSPTARLPRPSDCACAGRSSGSCWQRSAWSVCERDGTGAGPGLGLAGQTDREDSVRLGRALPHSSPGAVWWPRNGDQKRGSWN